MYPLSAIALCTFQRIFTETLQSYFFIAASGDRTVFGRSPITRTILKSSNKRISRSWPSPSILWTRRKRCSNVAAVHFPLARFESPCGRRQSRSVLGGASRYYSRDGLHRWAGSANSPGLLRHRTDRPNRCSRCLRFDQGSQAQKSTEW